MPKQPAKGQSRQKFDFRLKSIYIRNLLKCGSKFLSISLRAAFCWLQCGNERPIKRWRYEWMVTKWIKSHSTATVPFHLPLFITLFFCVSELCLVQVCTQGHPSFMMQKSTFPSALENIWWKEQRAAAKSHPELFLPCICKSRSWRWKVISSKKIFSILFVADF